MKIHHMMICSIMLIVMLALSFTLLASSGYMSLETAFLQLENCMTNQKCSVAVVRALHPTNRLAFCAQAEKAVVARKRIDPHMDVKKSLKTLQTWFFEATNPVPTVVLMTSGSLAKQAIELRMPVLEAGQLDVEIKNHMVNSPLNADGVPGVMLLENEHMPLRNPYIQPKKKCNTDIMLPCKGQVLSPF